MSKRVYLYAFNEEMRIVDVKFLEGDAVTITNMRRIAKWMKDNIPEKIVVYAVDNRPGLYKEFKETIRTKDFTKRIEFADLVSHEGKEF